MSRNKYNLEFWYDGNKDILEVEGLKFSGDFFREFSLPDENSVYSIKREGNIVTLTREGKLRQTCKHKTIFTYQSKDWCKDCGEQWRG